MTLTAVQTSMTTAPTNAMPGMLYDDPDNCDIVHKRAQEDIPFGAFVKVDADGCELPDSSGEVTGLGRGVALYDAGKASGGGYKQGDIVAVLVQGRAWIQAETSQTIAAYAVPFARYTVNGGLTVGGWRSDADSSKAAVPNSVFMFQAATNGGLGVVEFSTPQAGPVGPTS